LTVTADVAHAYVGEYDVEWLWNPASPQKGTITMTYNAQDSTLRAHTSLDGELEDMILAPVSGSAFIPIGLRDGQIMEAAETLILEFVQEGGKATSFAGRDTSMDKVAVKGKRRPGA
jgi:hypothetical protein